MKVFNFLEENFSQSFTQWVDTFAVETTHNNFRLLPELGTGNFKIFNIEPGLQVRLWECNLLETVTLHRLTQEIKRNRSFAIIFYLNPEAILQKKCGDNHQSINKIWNTVFLSSDAALDIDILPGKEVKICCINLSMEWLTTTLLKNNFEAVYKILIDGINPVCIFESAGNREIKKIAELYDEYSQKLLGEFFIHSWALYILNDFFTKLNSRDVKTILNQNFDPVMAELEKRIISPPGKKLHSLKKLSEEFSMSPSTIKRNFKKMFGKNITEYLREKKL
ncbi:MAG: helix-turn-helix transcriptional regulator [Chitinophagaceae bacterium]|nr:helix-turn-helix transcriptional regulator [Chitinophagaceae bacterium]